MRVISWNIRKNNRRAKKAVDFALLQKPDVLCLQEVSLSILEYLREIPGYSHHASYDFISRNPRKHGYTVTMTKFKTIDEMEIPYNQNPGKSLLNSVVYKKINRSIEQHNAIMITIKTEKKKLHIVNTRLSTAVNTRERLSEFYNLISRIPTDFPAIFCGDFNVSDSQIFNKLTGWFRGFKAPDYLINERNEFEILFKKYNLLNIFRGSSTSITNKPLLQFDHILIPPSFKVQNKQIFKKRYGSDHRMLFTEII